MDNGLVFTVLLVTLSWMSTCTCADNSMTGLWAPRTQVETLGTPVSRTGCGTQKLCVAEPSDCDPSVAGSCFFLAARQLSGQNFEFGLSGESSGYVAATLSPDDRVGNNDTTYVCANNNGTVRFFSTLLRNDQLIETELNVSSVKGSVNGSKIQCTFNAIVPNSDARASRFSLSISTGSFNSTTGSLGNPNVTLTRTVADLGNPNITMDNETSPTMNISMASTTTSAPVSNTTSNDTAQLTSEATSPPAMIQVETLETPVSRAGCGTQKLCVAEPSDCDPSVAGSCFFLAARQLSGQNFEFGLSGESSGYIAATLSPDDEVGNNDTTYVCANNNGNVRFFSTLLRNDQLIETELNVSSVKGSVNGSKIQCTFNAIVPNSDARASRFSLSISTGSFNSTTGSLGNPNVTLTRTVADLGNPNINMDNETSPTMNISMASTTTSAPVSNTTSNVTAQLTSEATSPPAMIQVETLETPVSRAGCGTQKLCAAEPSDCDPSVAGSCFFLAARQLSGQNFEFGLSGESSGYIAATLSPDDEVGNNDTTYVCANNNGNVRFFSTLLRNDQLIETELNVSSVKGSVNGSKIQCTFNAIVPNSDARASRFSLSISTGSLNSNSGDLTLGPPEIQFRSPVVDLGNPNSSVANQLSSTTVAPVTVTMSHAITFQQSLMQALLISVGVLGLAML